MGRASYAIPTVLIILIGSVFLGGGIQIALFVEPGDGAHSMNQSGQIYFGAIISAIGGGLISIALGDWLAERKK